MRVVTSTSLDTDAQPARTVPAKAVVTIAATVAATATSRPRRVSLGGAVIERDPARVTGR